MDLDKELHQRFLADIRCDVSQHSSWRIQLFENAENTKFEISSESVGDIFQSLSANIAKYDLRFIVEKVPNVKSGQSAKDVVFKFYPKNHPELVKYSFNNSASR